MQNKLIIGREKEQMLLQQLYDSPKSEFVSVCGRRRVGKTFLVREFFGNRMVFSATGIAGGNKREQLRNFHQSLRRQFGSVGASTPKDWLDAFDQLISCLMNVEREGKKVVFLDELPWMDSPHSGFISALENFWNGWATGRHDILLVVCGSATSWMMDKLIHNKGGLYNRLTRQLFLQPFTLTETEQMLNGLGFHLSRYETAECYMVFGGIPHYLSLLRPELSLAANIDSLLFAPQGELRQEFGQLYAALFRNSVDYVRVVSVLSTKACGMTRGEIAVLTGISSGGTLTTILDNLEACGFIRTSQQYGNKQKESVCKLTDFFTLFYFRFMKENDDPAFWTSIQGHGEFYNWAGHSFELLVASHIDKVKQQLGIAGVGTKVYAWHKPTTDTMPGAQIDLVIERKDNTINLCEMKFAEDEFIIDADYEKALRRKLSVFRTTSTTRRMSIVLTLITTYGVMPNSHSGIVQAQVTLDNMF